MTCKYGATDIYCGKPFFNVEINEGELKPYRPHYVPFTSDQSDSLAAGDTSGAEFAPSMCSVKINEA